MAHVKLRLEWVIFILLKVPQANCSHILANDLDKLPKYGAAFVTAYCLGVAIFNEGFLCLDSLKEPFLTIIICGTKVDFRII